MVQFMPLLITLQVRVGRRTCLGWLSRRVYLLLMTNFYFAELTGALRHGVEYIILGGRVVDEESLLKMANFSVSVSDIWTGNQDLYFIPGDPNVNGPWVNISLNLGHVNWPPGQILC